ncbi:hypothetical protein KPL71_007930 [Citrus sinensis]|uniref:Uncharacterized protein n=1 Tax=Citrus sinensis TaxID=2711 RepID=A0ACB8M3E3_CITSI|nr:hypothetical protein KPL71_007930 [Citrus sinensis]
MAAALSCDASQWEFSCDFEVDYESNENASIVYAALAIDKELQPDKVKRQISVINRKLLVHFEAVEARILRASFSAFVDVLTLAINNRTVWSWNGIVTSYYLWQLENHS